MNVKQDNPIPTSGSLIERASEIYDFGDLLKPVEPQQAAKVQPVPVSPEAAPVMPIAPVMPMPPLAMPAVPVPPSPAQVQTVVVAPPTAMTMPVAPIVQPIIPPVREETVAPSFEGLPHAAGRVAHIDLERLREAGFLEPGSAPTTLSEEFRLAKRQLLLAAFGGRNMRAKERARAILVCSSHPNEGKTFCSINLTLSLAADRDIEVVLVDADVAKPEILSTLGIEGGPGLMDAVSNPAINVEDLIVRTSLPTVSVLPTGRRSHNDTELLASSRTQLVIDALLAANQRRIVIIDTAPALAASPGSVLAHHVGQILMVVRADKTGENELREAISLLDGCPHMQLLLNGVTYSGVAQKYGSYYGYGG